ncbi:hypothetical protein BVC80_9083g48 [Macleaya cordata]|uniref:RING-type E3 ubiquitin transferase n=1 Tax=Macleaya cordata TaxID=56857 RepID=A0A200PRA3_MACCD|nr:hypothetical protein BVC80_9083g48 [Macleaya cordata]
MVPIRNREIQVQKRNHKRTKIWSLKTKPLSSYLSSLFKRLSLFLSLGNHITGNFGEGRYCNVCLRLNAWRESSQLFSLFVFGYTTVSVYVRYAWVITWELGPGDNKQDSDGEMLQIRLNKVEGGGGAKPLPVETVTVACPDHLILADLPVAKSIGAASATSLSKTVGRRSRRHLGERVHFCVRCDFPIAIYGRLSPCEHAFCLDCARSDSSCYLCDERIQKIQTIKMMEGIFICAAPHCLKSFLKRPDFESHIHESHADLLQPNTEKEDVNESDAFNAMRPSSTDPHAKQSTPTDSSTARAQPRSGFSPSSNPQPHDLEDRARRHQPRDQPPPKPIIQSKPPPYYGRHQNPPSELHPDNNPPQGFDRPGPYNRFPQQSLDMQGGPLHRRDSDQFLDKQQGVLSESPLSDYAMHSHQSPNFVVPVNANQGLAPTFSHSPFPVEGAQPFYNAHFETARPDLAAEGGSEQGSLLGFPPSLGGSMSFPDNYPRPWNMGLAGVPLEQMQASQGTGIPEGYTNLGDPQGRAQFFQGDYGRVQGGLPLNPPLPPSASAPDHKDGKGVLAPQPLPPPPPPPPPHLSQIQRGKFSNSGDTGREG